tara:strand:- start:6019 stop:7023 length:1005 start_codon:yes stop_codon:yes gene_type:complete
MSLEINKDYKKKWLITGVAGFIGSNLLEELLLRDQTVFGIDNFSTGSQDNLDFVKNAVGKKRYSNFTFVQGDICNYDVCIDLISNVDHVLHQAALGSVPRSIKDPLNSNKSNITGFLNMLYASKQGGVESFVYAASSSTYGDHPDLPKKEEKIGNPLSPYAVTKLVNEIYASVFSITYSFHSIGLRYFNVYGKYQSKNSSYAAVIPKWINLLTNNETIRIFGDGNHSRDFTHVDNVVSANLLASLIKPESAEVYNIACGDRTSLIELQKIIQTHLATTLKGYTAIEPQFERPREGDVTHSHADISKATKELNYLPIVKINEGLPMTIDWFIDNS